MYYQVDEFLNEPHAILFNEIYRLIGVKNLAVLRREQHRYDYEHQQEKNIGQGKYAAIEAEALDVAAAEQ
jgi:hypothetical protein